jgi:hypothetical protein
MTTLPEALGIIRRTLEIAPLVAGSMSGLFFQPEVPRAVGVLSFSPSIVMSYDPWTPEKNDALG